FNLSSPFCGGDGGKLIKQFFSFFCHDYGINQIIFGKEIFELKVFSICKDNINFVKLKKFFLIF
ncbi:MAG: hypothetical protein K2I12_01870, partial [Duncaniella sp.]|nr:hypothetical protein [Duncaniella sp.]